jgi:AmiR/NasT family two-component response regulator
MIILIIIFTIIREVNESKLQEIENKYQEAIQTAGDMEILDVLQSQSKQLSAMGDELLAVRATIEERKVIERAKGMLMAHQGLSEEGAYSAMRDKAMSQNQKLIDVAKSILSLSEFLKLKH